MNKKERVFAAIRGEQVDRVPVGFWLHFPKDSHNGDQSVQAHVDFFKQTNTDIVKIMNENLVPCTHQINKATDWQYVRPINMKDKFVLDQLDIIKRIMDKLGDEAVVITTIHGTVASAFHARGGGDGYETLRTMLSTHLREETQIVSDAFRHVSEGVAEFTKACLDAGAQGIYYAALGGESSLFTDEEFEAHIKPNDLMILEAAQSASAFNVLHMCKEQINFQRYKDYKPDVVNWAVHDNNLTLLEGKKLFPDSAVIGGLDDRSGVLVNGTDEEIEQAVYSILDQMGSKKFILGADCTLPTEISYAKIKTAVEAVEKYNKK
ncbi:uroporphyrinogen decarboxylase family protein [Paenibacillus eucommiae]|uniref:Uroporphyrinogen decarboxylase n=1 Tax=Paenibacillus eucommiae TaxID=1355755 RepID=A0ABS4IUF6_9BACL|nr:uroporphyrinogen decarboxylase family protein [Paenibacillus eucommiae]MBP1990646.1 uroporphyrinogen decarboxylase [Paenibacillus eucommiae]